MPAHSSCERHWPTHHVNGTVLSVHSFPQVFKTASGHNASNGSHEGQQQVETPKPDDYARKATLWSSSQDHLSCLRIERLIKCDGDARLPTFVICHAVLLRIEGTCILSTDCPGPSSQMEVGLPQTWCMLTLCVHRVIYFFKHQNKNDLTYVKEQIIVNILEKKTSILSSSVRLLTAF